MSRTVCITIDSDHTRANYRCWQHLPKACNGGGWNRIRDAVLTADGEIRWRDQCVCTLAELRPFYRGVDLNEDEPAHSRVAEDWYYVYVTPSIAHDVTREYVGTSLWEFKTLYFDGVPLTDAHVHFCIALPPTNVC